MDQKPTWLLDFKRNVYSQTGEDGVIEKIFEILPESDKWCVEFGASDGFYMSNTRNLIESEKYSGVLIEASTKRYKILEKNYENNNKIIAMNRFVGFREDDNLDHILSDTPIPKNFDLLSIDIDGNDYHVWKYISAYKPKVVVIEFNPTIPTNIRFIQPADPNIDQGTSLLSLVELGKEKGYELVSVLPCNAIFVQNEYFNLFGIKNNSPEKLRVDLECITYLFVGYDGKVFLRGNKKLQWHGIDIRESKLQQLPFFFRKYPNNYNKIIRKLFAIYRAIKQPAYIQKILRNRSAFLSKHGQNS